MKLASKCRTEVNLDAAQQLLAKVQQIAEMFWKSKGVDVKKQPSNQNAKANCFTLSPNRDILNLLQQPQQLFSRSSGLKVPAWNRHSPRGWIFA